MLTKATILDQIECTPNRELQLRLRRQILDDGKEIASEYHRTVVEPGVPVRAQMDYVHADLARAGFPPIDEASIVRIEKIAALEHTPAAIAAHRERLAAQERANKAQK